MVTSSCHSGYLAQTGGYYPPDINSNNYLIFNIMNIIFFNSETLVTREIVNALKKRDDLRLININIPHFPSSKSAEGIFEKLKEYFPAIILSINDAGYDLKGKLHNLISQSNVYQVNWYHDYPFYYNIFKNQAPFLSKNRIDFISEKSYVNLLRSNSRNGYFLPLATDPEYFNTNEPRTFERDIAFVGNSSMELMDTIITDETSRELERNKELFLELKSAYQKDFTFDIRNFLLTNENKWIENISIPKEKFIFCMEWMVGYMFRRDFIVDIAKEYENKFKVFGDLYWTRFIDKPLVTPEACYYDNLCHYYRTTKINLNVNRIQIATSFTQRHFDTKASGSFLLTDKRALNKEYFVTEGPNQEIAEFESLSNCHELIKYYLEHEEEREKIAEAGIKRILNNHTYDNRIDEIKEVCKGEWGI